MVEKLIKVGHLRRYIREIDHMVESGQVADRVSPFTLTYGMEAIILTEIGMPTLRTEIPEEVNTEALARDLDMTDELCEAAAVRMASYQQQQTYTTPGKTTCIPSRGPSLKKGI